MSPVRCTRTLRRCEETTYLGDGYGEVGADPGLSHLLRPLSFLLSGFRQEMEGAQASCAPGPAPLIPIALGMEFLKECGAVCAKTLEEGGRRCRGRHGKRIDSWDGFLLPWKELVGKHHREQAY